MRAGFYHVQVLGVVPQVQHPVFGVLRRLLRADVVDVFLVEKAHPVSLDLQGKNRPF